MARALIAPGPQQKRARRYQLVLVDARLQQPVRERQPYVRICSDAGARRQKNQTQVR